MASGDQALYDDDDDSHSVDGKAKGLKDNFNVVGGSIADMDDKKGKTKKGNSDTHYNVSNYVNSN